MADSEDIEAIGQAFPELSFGRRATLLEIYRIHRDMFRDIIENIKRYPFGPFRPNDYFMVAENIMSKNRITRDSMHPNQILYNTLMQRIIFTLTNMKIKVGTDRDLTRDNYDFIGRKLRYRDRIDQTIYGVLGHYQSLQYFIRCMNSSNNLCTYWFPGEPPTHNITLLNPPVHLTIF